MQENGATQVAETMDVQEDRQEAKRALSTSFGSKEGFELALRGAKLLSQSSLVPKEYQGNIPNCVIALNMANRMQADALMVMQNLYVVHGRPGWSSQFLISTFNNSGRFSALRYEWVGEEGKDSWGCRAWAIERATGEKLTGSTVTIKLAKDEGWYGKSGSKWKTMPQQMLMYRAASWFVRAYAPEIGMGMYTADEIADTIDITPDSYKVVKEPTGRPQDLNERLGAKEPPAQGADEEEPVDYESWDDEPTEPEQPDLV